MEEMRIAMNKIIGLLTAWGARRTVEAAAQQALEYCDEVMAVVSSFAPELRRFEDETYGILKKFKRINLLDYRTKETTISYAVADVLNQMLLRSSLYSTGNWVWILDADEFYADSASNLIRSAIDNGRYNQITAESHFFMINTHHYLNETGNRLFRIESGDRGFIPTNKWLGKLRNIYLLPRKHGMFHYGMLVSAEMYRMKWGVEYKGRCQDEKARWLDEIYYKYDLKNEDYWLRKNLEISGIRSPWFNRGFTPNIDGKLFRYIGKHPKFIEESGLTKIKDFREDDIK